MRVVPGDPVRTMLGEGYNPVAAAELRQQWGLDRPLHVQYITWVGDMLQGDLGRSMQKGLKVSTLIRERLPVTLELVFLSTALSLLLGIPLGAIAGRKPGSLVDAAATSFAGAGIGMPGFLVGVILIMILGIKLRLLPVSGYVPFTQSPAENLERMVLPSIVNAMAFLPVVVQQTRSAVLETYSMAFIAVARSKGLAERAVFSRHALKIVLLPIVTLTGLHIGVMFGSGVITETLFAIPGMGKLLVDSILGLDPIVVQAVVVLVAATVVLASLLVDIVYVYLDPRIKYR